MNQYNIILENGDQEIITIKDNDIIIDDKIINVKKITVSFFTSGNIGNSRIPPKFFLDFSYHIYELVINNKIRFSVMDNKLGRKLITHLYHSVNNNKRRYNSKSQMIKQCIREKKKTTFV